MTQRISGTKEWSAHSVNCITGCSHNCRYCYARARAVRFHQVDDADAWATMRVRDHDVRKRRRKLDGRIMFPTSHDVTPEVLGPCLTVLGRLLRSCNDVLIVSKPHLECVEAICRETALFREQVLFRFTIGARKESLLSYWEPGAPSYEERLASLRYAFRAGFATSVSCEPLLDASDAEGLVEEVLPFVTDTVWIGKLNEPRHRCIASDEAICAIEAGQTDSMVHAVFESLKYIRRIRWKESYKSVLGLALAHAPGLDI